MSGGYPDMSGATVTFGRLHSGGYPDMSRTSLRHVGGYPHMSMSVTYLDASMTPYRHQYDA